MAKRPVIPMRVKVRAADGGSMDYEGSISYGIEMAFYFLTAKERTKLLESLQKVQETLNAKDAAAGVPVVATDRTIHAGSLMDELAARDAHGVGGTDGR